MTKFLQTLVDAISVGSLYALIALGYTMVYGILQFINFAHSDVFMLGAFYSWRLATLFRINTPAVQPGRLPTIIQPRQPVIEPPPTRRPLPLTPIAQPAPLPRFESMGQLLGFVRANPGSMSDELINNWRRSLRNSWGR